MKKIIYISLLTCIFLISCGENDYMYTGEQTLFFGGDSVNFTVDEENTTYQLAYGLTYPADKDYEFTVKISENSGGAKVTANNETSGELTLKIAKGELIGYIDIEADFEELETNIDEIIRFEFVDKGNLSCNIINKTYTLVIRKFCTMTYDRMVEWEGIYKEVGKNYEMTVKHINGDTLEIDNFWGYNLYPQAQLAKLRVVLDYSTKNYVVRVVNGYLYTEPDGVPAYMRDNVRGNPIPPKAFDLCTKSMILYFCLEIDGGYYGYYQFEMKKES